MKVKHLLIEPSGDISWVELDMRRRYDDIYEGEYAYDLNQIYSVLDCGCVETVSLGIPDLVVLIDECGKITFPPRPHNELVSRLYLGYPFYDDIVGPALFFRREGPNIGPLLPSDEAKLSLFLGVVLPGK